MQSYSSGCCFLSWFEHSLPRAQESNATLFNVSIFSGTSMGCRQMLFHIPLRRTSGFTCCNWICDKFFRLRAGRLYIFEGTIFI